MVDGLDGRGGQPARARVRLNGVFTLNSNHVMLTPIFLLRISNNDDVVRLFFLRQFS